MPENLTPIQEMYRRHYGVLPNKDARHYNEFSIGVYSFIEHILLTSEDEQLQEKISERLYITTFFALSETGREGFIAAENERNNLPVLIMAHYKATAVYC